MTLSQPILTIDQSPEPASASATSVLLSVEATAGSKDTMASSRISSPP